MQEKKSAEIRKISLKLLVPYFLACVTYRVFGNSQFVTFSDLWNLQCRFQTSELHNPLQKKCYTKIQSTKSRNASRDSVEILKSNPALLTNGLQVSWDNRLPQHWCTRPEFGSLLIQHKITAASCRWSSPKICSTYGRYPRAYMVDKGPFCSTPLVLGHEKNITFQSK